MRIAGDGGWPRKYPHRPRKSKVAGGWAPKVPRKKKKLVGGALRKFFKVSVVVSLLRLNPFLHANFLAHFHDFGVGCGIRWRFHEIFVLLAESIDDHSPDPAPNEYLLRGRSPSPHAASRNGIVHIALFLHLGGARTHC